VPHGFRHLPGYLDGAAQLALLAAVRAIVAEAPLYTPAMPGSGRPLSVRMTNCGPLGWVTDKTGGYRYQALHPETGRPWPPIPPMLSDLWTGLTGLDEPAEACLVNYYVAEAKLGLHRDQDEDEPRAPVVSVSLGDEAWFRLGGPSRKDPTTRLKLRSGDVVVLGGEARMAFHGVDRILAGSSRLLSEGGRINLTLRRVTRLSRS
jgi:alkylated DNA repair protein (DNA oxidative demethylase)